LTAARFLIGIGGWLAVVAGWWARTHSDATPRYSAGYGSGFSPASRRFWGGVVLVVGLLVVLSATGGVPADLMH
jgi:hypothetical protein